MTANTGRGRDMFRVAMRTTAAAMVLGVGGLTAAPALAAAEVARGEASAITVEVNGSKAGDSGTYTASNDGSTETTSGSNRPAIAVPTGGTVNQGTLNQDAATSKNGALVSSTACAGISGKGATLVAFGSSRCLSADNPPTVALGFGALKLSTVTDALTGNQLYDALPQTLKDALTALLGQVTGGATSAQLQAALGGFVGDLAAALGNPSLSLDAGVIQGQCTATSGSASGAAQLVDAGVTVDFGAQANQLGLADVDLDLPSNPAPNTPLTVGLGDLTKQLAGAVTKQLVKSAPASPILAQVLTDGAGQLNAQGTAIVAQVVDGITSRLGPLDQLLKGTLNKQTRTGTSQIHVTALDVQVLPAAEQFSGASLAALRLGDVDCLGGRTATPVVDVPVSTVPTKIDSGLSGNPFGLPDGVLTALGALLLVSAGAVGVHRLRASR